MLHRLLHLWIPVALLPFAAAAAGGDIPNSKDHPLIKRYEGSTIIRYDQKAFDAFRLPVGPVTGRGNRANFPKALELEGRVTRITYLAPAGRSPLEVIRNYEAELKKAGFTTLFDGGHEALGQGRFDQTFATTRYGDLRLPSNTTAYFGMYASNDDRYVAAKLDRPEGDVHVAVYAVAIKQGWGHFLLADPPKGKPTAVDGQVLVQLDVIEEAPMETKMVTVSAGEMAKDIAASGSVALYGIHFDTNSATVKPESDPTLQEIAKLLKGNPAMRLLVVGHTDNVGTFEFNMDLSQRRAASVVQELVSKHGVDAKRLTPVGVSFASPVASNNTEDGRGKNRRVQLVENTSNAPRR